MKITAIYKITFKDGKTSYSRMTEPTKPSVDRFITSWERLINSRPERSAIEKKIINGEVAKCEIVFTSDSKEEGMKKRNELVNSDENCLNGTYTILDRTARENENMKTIKKEFSKAATSNGVTVYFILKTYGINKKWREFMNFNKVYPLNPNFCEISLELNRV